MAKPCVKPTTKSKIKSYWAVTCRVEASNKTEAMKIISSRTGPFAIINVEKTKPPVYGGGPVYARAWASFARCAARAQAEADKAKAEPVKGKRKKAGASS